MSDRLVYDSDQGPTDRRKRGRQQASTPPAGDGVVRIRRETGGRGGKTVTTIHGVPLAAEPLRALAKELKQRCGVGGAVKDGVIEIQGDHRDAIERHLIERGYTVKRAGG